MTKTGSPTGRRSSTDPRMANHSARGEERRGSRGRPRGTAVAPRAAVPTIQSLHRGLRILEAVAHRGAGMTLAEVSREVALHASTSFHLLRTLVALGYLIQDEASRQYRVGPRVLQVAAVASTESHLSQAAAPVLARMARDTGETSHLAVFDRGEVVVVNRVEGDSPVRVVERVGYPRPAHCTAIGKVLLAHLPREARRAFLARTRLAAMTAKTITAVGRLEEELGRVRARGHAVDDEEFARGIRCVAAPVRTFTGQVVAALGISGPMWRVELDRTAELIRVVKGAAAGLSRQLGHAGDGDGP